MDNNIAKQYIAWSDVEGCCLQKIDTFLLERQDEFVSFRSHVRDILDWGKGARLEQIRGALDAVLERGQGALLLSIALLWCIQ